MNPLVHEWIEKAEGDYATAGRELRARKRPNFDAACFHAQQCAEKYLKAFLQKSGIPFGRTHNLVALLDQAVVEAPGFELLRPDLQRLNLYAVQFRYPGESADKEIARQALALCRGVRAAVRG
ncbi:MAG TPA: HEPN domain-containing protein, partial [Phycisphaerae bacterium]|nr:HEPN domain-containing protein [Phycisphaerae bacterium]